MRDFDFPSVAETVAIPDFNPVPLARRRRDGWVPERQRTFIATLAHSGCVTSAARAAGMGVTSAYALRRRRGAASFAAAWDKALNDARRRTLEVAMEAAFTRSFAPRTYRGNFTGTLIRRDDLHVMLAALQAVSALSRAPPPK